MIRPVGDTTQSSLVRPPHGDFGHGASGVHVGHGGHGGLSISGGVITDDFRAGIRVGYAAGRRHWPSWYYPGSWSWGYGGWYWPGYWTTSYQTVGPERVYTPDPRLLAPAGQAPQQAEQPPSLLELAEWSLATGDAARAAERLEGHLASEPDDAGAKRLLGIALLEQRKTDQAVAVLMQAYLDQPMLARTPIEAESLFGGEMSHRARFTKLMDYANRTKTASGYLAASVLAQSEGRIGVAKKLLDRAADAGLARGVLDEMRLSLERAGR